MHSSEEFVARAETERQLLRFLCASGADVAARRTIFDTLKTYSWRDRDHQIIFEAIGDLLTRAPQQILVELPAALTRRGFPDISCDFLAASSPLSSAEAFALAEQLLRVSQ